MSDIRNYTDFIARWKRRRAEYCHLRASVDAASLIDDFLVELEELQRRSDDRPLTLAEAAHEGGYSIDHLGRLLREGKLANVGKARSPRIRRGDLPRKIGRQNGPVASASVMPYDVDADARSLLTVRRGE